MKSQYLLFDQYVLRTPLFSFSFFKNLTQETEISDEKLKKICSDEIVLEALFLASPTFYFEVKKWLNGEIRENLKVKKIKLSVLKYLSRMSSRCTPFGLFFRYKCRYF